MGLVVCRKCGGCARGRVADDCTAGGSRRNCTPGHGASIRVGAGFAKCERALANHAIRFEATNNRLAHMLFLDGVYVGEAASSAGFRWVKAPTSDELTQLTHTIAHRLARYLERHGLLVRDAEHSYLALDSSDKDPMDQLRGHWNSPSQTDTPPLHFEACSKASGLT